MVPAIVVNRAIAARSAILVGCLVACAFRVAGQTPPLPHPSVAPQPSAPLSSTDPVVHKGLFTIDAVVSDASGRPVSNLEPWDFTLLDNGQPAKIRTFQNSLAESGPASGPASRPASEPPPKLIFVLDTINLSPQQLTQTESAIAHFLLRKNGHLEFPCLLYRLTRAGLFSSLRPSMDGTLLVKELDGTRSLWAVSNADRREIITPNSWASGSPRNRLSLRALGAIAINQRDVPGHKVVLWIGPGWPVNGGDTSFDDATELSTRLLEARITLDNLNVWLNPVPSFNYHDYLDAPRSQKEMQLPQMSLQVIATHTGGLVLDSSEDLDQDIDQCVEELRSFYTITFNPPPTDAIDEFHDLRVELRAVPSPPSPSPVLTVRAATGYYNQPVYFDHPRPGIEKVTVAQLEALVHAHTDLLRKLDNLELTERLSTPRFDALLSEIHSESERQALTADADLSFALPPPPGDIPNRPLPPLDEQRAILRRSFDYLQNAIPRLPDFYALRNTARFEEPLAHNKETWKMLHQDRTLQVATGEHATVLYRNGHEVDEQKKKLGKRRAVRGVRAGSLEIKGTFGPILAWLLRAAATSGTLSWKRWERGNDGDLAVFSYRVAGANSPEITYCCLLEGDGTTLYQNQADTYGEFAVNPATGAIMRILINADLDEERDPDAPLIRSQVMVEYGPEELGGKTYICPRRSVEVSRGRSKRELQEWGMDFSVYGYFETMINDMTFGGYHKFGSESRILPGFEVTQ